MSKARFGPHRAMRCSQLACTWDVAMLHPHIKLPVVTNWLTAHRCCSKRKKLPKRLKQLPQRLRGS